MSWKVWCIFLFSILVEGVVLSQLPVATVVPSLGLLTLVVLKFHYSIQGWDTVALAIAGGLVVSSLHPANGLLAVFIFTTAALALNIFNEFSQTQFITALFGALVWKHLVLWLSLMGGVAVQTVFVYVLIDFILCLVAALMLQRKPVKAGSW